MNLLIINGPNLNLLGEREPEIYGKKTLKNIEEDLKNKFADHHLSFFQSNSESDIINKLQNSKDDGIVLNAAAYSHYSIAILDAIKAIKVPVIEVHISHIFNRDDFRKKSIISEGCIGMISGFGINSYHLAIEAFLIRETV
jgi:3-dehydroquinate dehydratase II